MLISQVDVKIFFLNFTFHPLFFNNLKLEILTDNPKKLITIAISSLPSSSFFFGRILLENFMITLERNLIIGH